MAKINDIIEWQRAISPERNDDEPLLIANLYKACSALYVDVLEKLSSDPSSKNGILLSLQRSHSYLVLWADGYSVSNGLLDASLDKSRRAKRSTIRHLFSISQTITKRLLKVLTQDEQAVLRDKAAVVFQAADRLKYLARQDESTDSDSDTSSDTSSVNETSELEEIAEDLRIDTECLLDLGSRFNENTVGPVVTETAVDATLLNTWDPSDNFVDRVRWRYPKCEVKLAERLGKANWDRVIRCQERKSANNWSSQNVEAQPVALEPATNINGSIEEASTAFHDSALGSSIPSVPSIVSKPAASLYAETIVSYRGGQGESVRVPSLPEGALKSKPFVCVGCGETVKISRKSAWKKHLFSDIQPYVCVVFECKHADTPFSTKNEWENHVAAEHDIFQSSLGFDCPICQDNLIIAPIQIRSHIARHLEEIALTILPTNPDSEDGTDVDSGLASSSSNSQSQADYPAPEDEWSQTNTTYVFDDELARIENVLLDPLLKSTDAGMFQACILKAREELHFGLNLREIEMTLISRATIIAPTPQDFQRFALLVLSTIRGNLAQFGESSRVETGGRPYDEGYFVESEKHVRRTARRMNDELERQRRQTIPPSIGYKNEDVNSSVDAQSGTDDDKQPTRLSTRRRRHNHYAGLFAELFACKEPGCDKEFTRRDNLKRHQKITGHHNMHTRPFKCPIPTCKYHEHGWPTEKEMDRHYVDKHSSESVQIFECHFKPCPYKSKRESNCKQHMEKAHGWTYVRSKRNDKKAMNEAENKDGVKEITNEPKEVNLASVATVQETPVPESSPSRPTTMDLGFSQDASSLVHALILRPLSKKLHFRDLKPVLDDIYRQITNKTITCIRDVEKELIHGAMTKAKSSNLYVEFCFTSIRYIKESLGYFSIQERTKLDQQPYNDAYFSELADEIHDSSKILVFKGQEADRVGGAAQDS